MALTAAATASLLRALACWAVTACGLCVTTERLSTAVSGSTLVTASPATVTFVVWPDYFEQPATRSSERHVLIKSIELAPGTFEIGDRIFFEHLLILDRSIGLDMVSFHRFQQSSKGDNH